MLHLVCDVHRYKALILSVSCKSHGNNLQVKRSTAQRISQHVGVSASVLHLRCNPEHSNATRTGCHRIVGDSHLSVACTVCRTVILQSQNIYSCVLTFH